MTTKNLLNKIYNTKDVKRFKRTMLKFFRDNNYREIEGSRDTKNDQVFRMVVLHYGFSRTIYRVTFSWVTNNKFYLMCFRTVSNHYLFIEKDDRFYEHKTEYPYETVVSPGILNIEKEEFEEFTITNKELLTALEKEYTKTKKHKNIKEK